MPRLRALLGGVIEQHFGEGWQGNVDVGSDHFLSVTVGTSGGWRGGLRTHRRALSSSFFDCYCATHGKCFKKKEGHSLLACPRDYHRDDAACRPRRVFQTIVTGGCLKPPYKQEFPPPPEDSRDSAITFDEGTDVDNQEIQAENEDQPVDQSKCADKDKEMNHFILHLSSFEDTGRKVTCAELKALGGCDDEKRPSLSPKVRQECPCTCGASPPAVPKQIPPPPKNDAAYTQKLRQEHPCWKDSWDFAHAIELYEYKGHIKVRRMDVERSRGCGVNRSPLRFHWPCMESFPFFLIQPLAKGPFGFGSGNDNKCSGNPAYDDGVRIGSELVEVDGSQDFRQWGKDALHHLDRNKCHELVFTGPDAPWFGQFNYNAGGIYDPSLFFRCQWMSDSDKNGPAGGGWAPEGCKGMGTQCKPDEICCVKHKTLQHKEDAFLVKCPNRKLCKDHPVCKEVEWPAAHKDEDGVDKVVTKPMPSICAQQVYDKT